MANYVKSTNFASKDALAVGNPLKIVKGTEIDAEFNNIATAVATKADSNSPTFIGTPAAPTASAGNNTTQLATTAFVKTAVDNYDAALTVSTAQIEDNAVTTAKVADNAITAAKIADNAVGTSEIAADAITQAKMADNSVGTAELVNSSVTAAKIATGTITGVQAKALADYSVLTVTAADTYSTTIGSGFASVTPTTSSSSNVVAYRYTIALYTGTIRFKATHAASSTFDPEGGTITSASILQLYKNNTLIQTYTASTTTPVQRTNDVSIVPGDVIEWRHRTDNGLNVSVSSPTDTASNGYITRPLYIAAV